MTDDNPIIDDINRIGNETPPSVVGGAQQLLTIATSGALAIDPEAGQSLLNAINHALDELNAAVPDMSLIEQPTPLGMTAGGQIISKFNAEVATSGPKAFVPAHQQFMRILTAAAGAVRTALDNYAKAENVAAQSFQDHH